MPKAFPVLETIKENLTLSGADAYTEIELTLLEEIGKRSRNGKSIKCMMIWGIELEFVSGQGGFDAALGADGDSIELQITTNSESAMVESVDKDCFFKYKASVMGAPAAGAGIYEWIKRHWFPAPLPYIKKRMWIGADSNAITAPLDVNVTLYVSYSFLSQYTLNRMIATKI